MNGIHFPTPLTDIDTFEENNNVDELDVIPKKEGLENNVKMLLTCYY